MDTIEIKDFVTAVRFMLDCGYEYGWNCYGEESCGIGWTAADNKASSLMIYDARDGRVFEVSVWDDEAHSVPRWIRKGFKAKHDREARLLNVDPDIAIDRVRYEDVSADEVLATLKRLVKRKTNGR